MKQVFLSLILSAVFLLPAAELPGWFSRNENGRISMGGTALSLTHLSPRWKQTSLRFAGKVRFVDEAGAVICDYPKGSQKPVIPIPYCEECMTGFEYAFAGLLISEVSVKSKCRQ